MAELPDSAGLDQGSFNTEMAAVFDEILNAMQSGQPVDQQDVLVRHPGLKKAMDALGMFTQTTAHIPPVESVGLTRPERIGPYRIDRDLGTGGFGAVYLGYDPDVKRPVAVKVLHPGRLDQPEAISRFHREAHATGKLRHPGIVQLFDYSRQGPPYYLVTEYVEGLEPRKWSKQNRCTPPEIAELVARMADAVDYAHQQGVCHRDLKPGNILVDSSGLPHILDFGLARLDTIDGVTLTAATQEGYILGSLAYMPPEQASGNSHTADARSDVYSLGVILFELLTESLPFQGPAHALPAKLLEETAPSPRSIKPNLSRDLEAICLKALSRHPQDRYATAASFADDLRAYAGGQPVAARRLTWYGQILRTLDRRHFEIMRQGWKMLLLLFGVTILIGCVICNVWELNLSQHYASLAILATKAVQVGVMLVFVFRLRPIQQSTNGNGGSFSSSRLNKGDLYPAMSAAERQIWSLVPGYYGSFLTLLILNNVLDKQIPLAPVLAVLSGMGFATLGATIWGWFYVWSVAFFLLSIVILLCAPYGMGILGLGWFVCLVVGSIHLHYTR